MKILSAILFLISSIPSLFAQSYQLSVNEGYGDGLYQKGESVHVWAETPDNNKVFIKWEGSASPYLNLNEWHTTLNIPQSETQSNFELHAVYSSLPSGIEIGIDSLLLYGEYDQDASTRFAKNKVLYSWIPKDCKAAVFVLHGTNGSAENMNDKFEISQVSKLLLLNGYAVFYISSNETTLGDQNQDDKKRWIGSPSRRDTSDNIDLKNIKHAELIIRSQFDLETVPFYCLGVSNGAVFSDLCAAVFEYRAVAHIVGHGNPFFFEFFDSPRPTIWVMVENDHQAEADNDVAQENYERLIEKGIETEWYLLNKSPVYAQRFTRNSTEINESESQEIFNTLVEYDLVDENHFINVDTLEIEFPFTAFYNQLSLTFKQEKQVTDQLKILNADHSAPGDYHNQIVRFFDSQLMTTPSISIGFEERIQLFPNPSNDYLNWDVKSNLHSAKIIDASGRIIKNLNEFHARIDISYLSSGVYYLELESNHGTSVTRFVKM